MCQETEHTHTDLLVSRFPHSLQNSTAGVHPQVTPGILDPQRLCLQGVVRSAFHPLDTLTHPAHRPILPEASYPDSCTLLRFTVVLFSSSVFSTPLVFLVFCSITGECGSPPGNPALGRLRQGNRKFKTSPGCVGRLHFKKKLSL